MSFRSRLIKFFKSISLVCVGVWSCKKRVVINIEIDDDDTTAYPNVSLEVKVTPPSSEQNSEDEELKSEEEKENNN